jgi:hypothetical protein
MLHDAFSQLFLSVYVVEPAHTACVLCCERHHEWVKNPNKELLCTVHGTPFPFLCAGSPKLKEEKKLQRFHFSTSKWNKCTSES